MVSTLKERFLRSGVDKIEDGLIVEPGSMNDYHELAEHHYKAAVPATVARYFVLKHHAMSAVARYLDLDKQSRVVGILVESMPVLHCKMRGWALHDRYSGLGDATSVGRLVKKELRCISRVVVHPQWRGLGLAVRLVRAALAQPTTMFTEAMAAMGHVNPFFERAGMTAYHRPPHQHDARLIAVLEAVDIAANDLVSVESVCDRIGVLPATKRHWVLAELRRWYHAVVRRSGKCSDPHQQLLTAQQRLLSQPVYYLKDNRSDPGDESWN